ncbi:MAG: alpha/beta hydrolase [Woeseiaceae bacterium]|nr:alpha/beta hydrolase [Woeseiaceae bacterium]
MRAIPALLLLGVGALAQASECVVLLHGMARTPYSLEPMNEALQEAGFATANIGYPSRKHTIEVLAPMAVGEGLDKCRSKKETEKIHFVTHSLGGILLRLYLSENVIPELGRVVMMGPPNQGSDAADEMRNFPGFGVVNGPAALQLGKGEGSVPLALGPANFELGVIAGTRTIDPVTSSFLENPDDGRVSVEDTKLEGMKDHVIVDHSHAFMMRMNDTKELTIRFLKTGKFSE